MVEPGLRWVQASWRFANRASIGGGPPARLQSSAATRSLWGLSGTRLGGRVRVARCTPRRRGRRRVDAPRNFREAGSVTTTAPPPRSFGQCSATSGATTRATVREVGRHAPRVPRHQVLAVKPHARVIVNGGSPSGAWYASCCPHRRARTQPGTHTAPGPPSPEKE